MAYPPLDTGRYGAGTPIDIADANKLWQGSDRTNGFLMRNADNRIPALEESFAKAVIDVANPLFDTYVMPWGNALWFGLANIDTQPHTVHAEKPVKAWLGGVLKFQQGWQTGNPVQNFGLPPYSRGTLIRKGPVGYKVALAPGADPEDYLAYLKGDASKDVAAVRTVYDDWVALLKAGNDGDRLGLFFDNASGFPVVAVVAAASGAGVSVLTGTPGTTYDQGDFSQVTISAPGGMPVLAGASFAGFAEVLESENKAVYFMVDC